MHGLIGRLTTHPGQRDKLVTILLDGISNMPGCLSYVVATDPADADTVWITEVWDNTERHRASLTQPRVQQTMALGKPLIASFGPMTSTAPVGGLGLSAG